MNFNECKLFAVPCTKEGCEKLTDYYLVWTYEGRLHFVRVRPCFWTDLKSFHAHALKIGKDEPFQKYL